MTSPSMTDWSEFDVVRLIRELPEAAPDLPLEIRLGLAAYADRVERPAEPGPTVEVAAITVLGKLALAEAERRAG